MKRLIIIMCATAVAPFAVLAAGLGPQSYVRSGLVTQFDAIDNEGTGTHNASATVWKDLKGSASITLQSGANWTGRYFDSTYDSKHKISGMPAYKKNSLTVESAIRLVDWSGSGTFPRVFANGEQLSFFIQDGHAFFYPGVNSRPHAYFRIGTLAGYSSTSGYGMYIDGATAGTKYETAVYGTIDLPAAEWSLNGHGGNLRGHYYAIRFYDHALSETEIMTNAVIDKLRFFSFKYDGADANWADIAWEAPESTASTPPTAPGSSTTDYVQIIGSQVTVASSDAISLMGLSLEDGATLDLPSGSRAEAKVLYVNGQPVKKGLYSGDGVGGVQVSWLAGSGVLAVAGATDGSFPTGTYVAPDANGYYVFGRTSANGGMTDYHSGAKKWYIRGERPVWSNYWFPEGSKLKLVGYVLLNTIPAGVFSEIDLSEAEHILLCDDKAISDGSALTIPSGVEFRYQPASSISYDGGNGNYYLLTIGDSPETGDLVMNGTLRIYGDGGGLLNSQQYTGAVSGTGTIQFGNFNKAARFSGPFTFKGTATGFNNASLLWVDSLDVDASLGDVTLNNGGNYTGNASLNANGIFFGKNGSGETANGKVNIGVLDGQARDTTLRGGGALAVWGGNTIHVDKLRSALHVVGRPQDLGCTWSWFNTASAVGNGNVEIDDADFTGNIYLSTNVNLRVGKVTGKVTFDYDTYLSGTVNGTTLDITTSCNSSAIVKAKDLALLPARLSGFAGTVTLIDTAAKSYTVPMDFSQGTDTLYNTVGCIGSGTLAAAPSAGTINVTFDTTAEPVAGNYAVARFTSGGSLLGGWTVTLNGVSADSATVYDGKYNVSVCKDATGIWLKVAEVKGLMIVIR